MPATRGARGDVRPAAADSLAEAGADNRGALHRLPVRLGRRERDDHLAVRTAGARRLRLLGLRLARLQAAVLCQRGGSSPTCCKGRTTYAMAARSPRAKRIALAKLQPADVIFFGAARPEVEAGAGEPHGHLPRQRLVHPLLRLRRRRRPVERLVRAAFRLGSQAARRSRPRFSLVRRIPLNPPLGGWIGTCRTGESPRLASSRRELHECCSGSQS